MFVCLRHSSGVDSSHIVVVDECAQNGFYRAAPPFDQPAVVGFVLGKFFVHFIIKGLVDTVFNLFELGYLAAACRPEWTLSAILFTAAIALLLIAFTVG